MSGYGYPSDDQSNYSFPSAYQTSIPQYTQLQINQYYAQYHCYPPQPYHIIPDYYVQPVTMAQSAYHQPMPTAYDTTQWQSQLDTLDLPTSQAPSRSNSRTKTWTCEIQGCTSSANFTRLADLQRHQSTVHGMGTPEYPCTVPRCNRVGDKGFTRRDHLVEHLRNFHHIDIPKRRPGERSAFPFGWPEGGLGGQGSQAGGSAGEASISSSSGAVVVASGGGETIRGRGRTRGGRVVKPSRRGNRAAGRSRGSSRAAGIGRAVHQEQEEVQGQAVVGSVVASQASAETTEPAGPIVMPPFSDAAADPTSVQLPGSSLSFGDFARRDLGAGDDVWGDLS